MSAPAKLRSVLPENNSKSGQVFHPLTTVYLDETNRKGQLENVMKSNDVFISWNNITSGSAATLRIPPSYKLLYNCVLEIAIKRTRKAAANKVGFTTDWIGHSLITSFAYKVPGCERQVMDGSMLPLIHLDQCETSDKKKQLLELSGMNEAKEGAGPIDAATIIQRESSWHNNRLGVPQGQNLDSWYTFHYVMLPLPNCSVCANPQNRPKPLPLYLLGEPLELEITWGNIDNFIPGGASGFVIGNARLLFEYGDLGSMDEFKQITYKYPFQAFYSSQLDIDQQPPNTGNGTVNSSAATNNVNILGLRNGEMSQLYVYCALANEITNSAGARKYYRGLRMKNISLIYAGQLIWNAPNDSEDMYDLFYNKINNYWEIEKKITIPNIPHLPSIGATSAGQTVLDYRVTAADPGVLQLKGTAAAALTVGAVTSSNIFPLLAPQALVDVRGFPQRYYYYKIPIAEILDAIKVNDYVLGADFNYSDLKLSFDLEMQYDLPSIVPPSEAILNPMGLGADIDSVLAAPYTTAGAAISGFSTNQTKQSFYPIPLQTVVNTHTPTIAIGKVKLFYMASINSVYRFNGRGAVLQQ